MAYCLRPLFGAGYVEYTLSCNGVVTHVLAAKPGFIALDQTDDAITIRIRKECVVKVFFEETPQ